jgi:hypothetical protein
MTTEYVTQVPPKMTITNLTLDETVTAQYNPASFEEEIASVWTKQKVPGLSHQVKQFEHTDDLTITLTLEFDATNGGRKGWEMIMHARRILQASVYPIAGAGNVRTGGAPRLLFVWPSLIALTCVLTRLRFSYERFNVYGELVMYSAALTLEEIRDVLITSYEVSLLGSERSVVTAGDKKK